MYRIMSHWFGIGVFFLALAPFAISGATSSDANVKAAPEKAQVSENLIADRGHRGHHHHHHHRGHGWHGGWGGTYYYNSSPYYYYPNYYRGYYSPYYYNYPSNGYYYSSPYYYNTGPGFSLRIGL